MYATEILDYTFYAHGLEPVTPVASRTQPRHPPVAANLNMANLSPEAALYWEFLIDLLRWAVTGYPPERLSRDLRWHAAR